MIDENETPTGDGEKKKKYALNISVTRELHENYKKYPGNAAKIISGLSMAFFDEVKDHPELFQHVIDGEITVRYQIKKKSE